MSLSLWEPTTNIPAGIKLTLVANFAVLKSKQTSAEVEVASL